MIELSIIKYKHCIISTHCKTETKNGITKNILLKGFTISGIQNKTIYKSIDKAKEWIDFDHDVRFGKFKNLKF